MFRSFFAAVAAAIILPAAANAAVLYQQAIDLSGSQSSNCSFQCFATTWWGDGFTLGAQSNITGFSFDIWELRGNTNPISTIQWALFNDDGAGRVGTPVVSGSASSWASTNNGVVPVSSIFDHVTLSVDIADQVLNAGNYWLGLRLNTPTTSTSHFWAYSAQGDCRRATSTDGGVNWVENGLGGTGCSGINMAFAIEGARLVEPPAVPLPAAGFLLIAGLGGLAAIRRQQK